MRKQIYSLNADIRPRVLLQLPFHSWHLKLLHQMVIYVELDLFFFYVLEFLLINFKTIFIIVRVMTSLFFSSTVSLYKTAVSFSSSAINTFILILFCTYC